MEREALLDITIVVAAALLCGLALRRLRQPPIVGYILAGAVFGPSALGLIENREAIATLAELGVLLLLFTIGMELSLRAFRRVLRVALLASAAQILLAVGVMLLLGTAFGWPMPLAVLLGFVVALSSTAVAFKILEEIDELRTDVGRVAVGVLIAQDLAVVPMLLLVDGMAGEAGLPKAAIGKVLLAVGLLALMIAYLTRRERVSMPFVEAIGENVELVALVALTFCFCAALLSALFGLSPAYGAFLAGLWIGNSHSRTTVLSATLPIQGVLLMVFFLSIGILLDLGFIWENIGQVVALLVVVTLFKTAMNVTILRLLGEPWARAWLAGVVIGQIGEFSFVLLAAGAAVGVIGTDDQRLIIAVIALSLMTSPLWLMTARRLSELTWTGISGVRQLLGLVYAPETRALAVASRGALVGCNEAMRATLRLGEQGVEAYQRLRQGQGEETPEDPSRDVSFERDLPLEPTPEAEEVPRD